MTSTLNASATTPAPEIDINSLLTHMKTVEGDKEKLLQQVQIMQEKIGKLTEGKKAEMQKALDTVIADWLKESVADEAVRAEFQKGMARLVDQTAEESGVWRVVCCASNLHAQRLQELETLRTEVTTLKTSGTITGKRPFDEINKDANKDQVVSGGDVNIWEEFANHMKGKTFEPTL